MDMYCETEDNPQPVEIPEDFGKLEDFGTEYYSSTVKDRAVLFSLEVLCNWTVEGYEEELGDGNFEHYKDAEEIHDECPQKMKGNSARGYLLFFSIESKERDSNKEGAKRKKRLRGSLFADGATKPKARR